MVGSESEDVIFFFEECVVNRSGYDDFFGLVGVEE